mmetsp:Transcript_6841/g.13566  ORF Transcript_6841/g.13566 Transcript_6841/m.13566 type:complete len:181 (-) Transcript_6841:283-825(-)|eukprot:CAMPEP_0170173412 /NCGR_PEP_ID=MMETSP0040_2-20121228/6704_1 /TAXON_ID=641309 /ORGANISM="Lotharella oceanica, Strain CCMP622" /LENGTH=180 /DNA_ID=CAMNT_0010414583 /DNA_START=98 /DNA_END=640 /DNA_ORIENTATION=-
MEVSLCLPLRLGSNTDGEELGNPSMQSPRGFKNARGLAGDVAEALALRQDGVKLYQLVPLEATHPISPKDLIAVKAVQNGARDTQLTAKGVEALLRENDRLKSTVHTLSKSLILLKDKYSSLQKAQHRENTPHERKTMGSADNGTSGSLLKELELELDYLDRELAKFNRATRQEEGPNLE